MITPASTRAQPMNIDLSRPRGHVLANAEMIVADLDQTLASTKHVHRAIIGAYLEKLEPGIPGFEIDREYSALRGKSYHEILSGMLGVLHLHRSEKLSLEDFSAGFFSFARDFSSPHPSLRAHEVPGARKLLEEASRIGVSVIVCTGSPRALAERFIRDSDLEDLVSCDKLFCWGDTAFSKKDGEFWNHALGSTNRERIIALDDHPHSAELVLAVGGIGGAVVLPSVPVRSFDTVLSRHGQRVRLVSDSWDNWA